MSEENHDKQSSDENPPKITINQNKNQQIEETETTKKTITRYITRNNNRRSSNPNPTPNIENNFIQNNLIITTNIIVNNQYTGGEGNRNTKHGIKRTSTFNHTYNNKKKTKRKKEKNNITGDSVVIKTYLSDTENQLSAIFDNKNNNKILNLNTNDKFKTELDSSIEERRGKRAFGTIASNTGK
jgi:hypothetical protein